jgi:hypothetical protein
MCVNARTCVCARAWAHTACCLMVPGALWLQGGLTPFHVAVGRKATPILQALLASRLVGGGNQPGSTADEDVVDMWELFTGQKTAARATVDLNSLVDDVRNRGPRASFFPPPASAVLSPLSPIAFCRLPNDPCVPVGPSVLPLTTFLLFPVAGWNHAAHGRHSVEQRRGSGSFAAARCCGELCKPSA